MQVGFLGLLGLILITLKLCSVIDWSWWGVLAPLWVPPAILLSIGIVMFVFVIIIGVISSIMEK